MCHIPCKDMKSCLNIYFHLICVGQNRFSDTTNSSRKRRLHSESKDLCFRNTNSISSWADLGQRVSGKCEILPETQLWNISLTNILLKQSQKIFQITKTIEILFLLEAKFINLLTKAKIISVQYCTKLLKLVWFSKK